MEVWADLPRGALVHSVEVFFSKRGLDFLVECCVEGEEEDLPPDLYICHIYVSLIFVYIYIYTSCVPIYIYVLYTCVYIHIICPYTYLYLYIRPASLFSASPPRRSLSSSHSKQLQESGACQPPSEVIQGLPGHACAARKDERKAVS